MARRDSAIWLTTALEGSSLCPEREDWPLRSRQSSRVVRSSFTMSASCQWACSFIWNKLVIFSLITSLQMAEIPAGKPASGVPIIVGKPRQMACCLNPAQHAIDLGVTGLKGGKPGIRGTFTGLAQQNDRLLFIDNLA
ncbi:hypothetical protein D3C75_1043550 [compost metagenome]